MATQTVQMVAPNLPGTVTIKLFTVETDILVATSATAVKGTFDKTFYTADFTNVPGATTAGVRFRCVLLDGTDEIVSDHVFIKSITDDYPSEGIDDHEGFSDDDLAAIIAGVQGVSGNIQQSQLGNLTAFNFATWTTTIENLSILTGYDEIVMTLKRNAYDLDADALLKVSDIQGVQVLNGVAQTVPNTDAVITVLLQTPTGTVRLVVESSIMAAIPTGTLQDGWKKLETGGSDNVLRAGKTIVRDSGVDETS